MIGAGITVTQKELRNHFHLPLHTVAKKFGMCTTAFKKLCRRFGIAKWPHRQLRGIDKKIAALKAELNYSTVDKESACRNLLKLEDEKAKLSQGAEWTGLGLHLEGESRCDTQNVENGAELESSSRRVGIRNLLCDVEDDDDDVDTRDLADDGDDGLVRPASWGSNNSEVLADDASSFAGAAVTEDILREHFHLPLQVVAKKFGMCTTALKKLCRRFGIVKWPHRQLRGIDKKIAALKAELNYSTVDKESARRNLEALEEEKSRLSRVALGHSPASGSGFLSKGLSKEAASRTSSAASAAQAVLRKRKVEGGDEAEANKSARIGSNLFADASALDLLASVAGIRAPGPVSRAHSNSNCAHTSDIATLMSAPSHQRRFSDTMTGQHLAPLQPSRASSGTSVSSLSHAHAHAHLVRLRNVCDKSRRATARVVQAP